MERVTSDPLLVQQATVDTVAPYITSKVGGPAIT
jgi:hypothetical protein